MAFSGNMSDEAMDRAVAALKVCADRIRRRGVTHGRYVATEACRQAANGPEFIARVEQETGLTLEAIPSREEAELTLAGCLPLLDPEVPYALTFDVGGGSAEVLWIRLRPDALPQVLGWISLPCGVVTVTERYGSPEIGPEDYCRLVNDIQELVVAGCGVLEAVCRTWPTNRMRVADRGVREGILLALARQAQRDCRPAPPQTQLQS